MRSAYKALLERDGLPGFSCSWDARKGARQLHEVFTRIGLDKDGFAARPFTRLKQLRYLSQTGQIDDRFFWTH